MNLQNVRWIVVVTTTVVTLGVLFGGGFLLTTRTQDEPLSVILTTSEAVESHTVERQGKRQLITVRLKETDDLAQVYTALDEGLRGVLKESAFTLRIEDRRTPELMQLYRRVNLFVHEAVATGRFAEMADQVETEAERAGVRARLGVDNDRVYLQLHAGGAYLYSVLARPDQTGQRAAEGGTGL